MVEHWITEYSTKEKVSENVNAGWEEPKYRSDTGPIVVNHKDEDKEVSIVRATHTNTFRIECSGSDMDEGVGESYNLNKEGFENVLEWLDNYTKRFA